MRQSNDYSKPVSRSRADKQGSSRTDSNDEVEVSDEWSVNRFD